MQKYLRDRKLKGILDRTAPNHKPILNEIHWIVIGVWLSHSPQAYGFESGLWQASMVCKMIYWTGWASTSGRER